ncbi:MAG TPA: hypothetical protein VF240_14185, partial [Pyrinomonadaceae bacterium]
MTSNSLTTETRTDAPQQTTARSATVRRQTKETDVSVALTLDGGGNARVNTGVAFLDHMLELFARHALFDLAVE